MTVAAANASAGRDRTTAPPRAAAATATLTAWSGLRTLFWHCAGRPAGGGTDGPLRREKPDDGGSCMFGLCECSRRRAPVTVVCCGHSAKGAWRPPHALPATRAIAEGLGCVTCFDRRTQAGNSWAGVGTAVAEERPSREAARGDICSSRRRVNGKEVKASPGANHSSPRAHWRRPVPLILHENSQTIQRVRSALRCDIDALNRLIALCLPA